MFHSHLTGVHDDGAMKVQEVRKWYKEFENGRLNIHHAERTNRPSTSRTDVCSARLSELVLNRRVEKI
jgi:hypothetical protein